MEGIRFSRKNPIERFYLVKRDDLPIGYVLYNDKRKTDCWCFYSGTERAVSFGSTKMAAVNAYFDNFVKPGPCAPKKIKKFSL